MSELLVAIIRKIITVVSYYIFSLSIQLSRITPFDGMQVNLSFHIVQKFAICGMEKSEEILIGCRGNR